MDSDSVVWRLDEQTKGSQELFAAIPTSEAPNTLWQMPLVCLFGCACVFVEETHGDAVFQRIPNAPATVYPASVCSVLAAQKSHKRGALWRLWLASHNF